MGKPAAVLVTITTITAGETLSWSRATRSQLNKEGEVVPRGWISATHIRQKMDTEVNIPKIILSLPNRIS